MAEVGSRLGLITRCAGATVVARPAGLRRAERNRVRFIALMSEIPTLPPGLAHPLRWLTHGIGGPHPRHVRHSSSDVRIVHESPGDGHGARLSATSSTSSRNLCRPATAAPAQGGSRAARPEGRPRVPPVRPGLRGPGPPPGSGARGCCWSGARNGLVIPSAPLKRSAARWIRVSFHLPECEQCCPLSSPPSNLARATGSPCPPGRRVARGNPVGIRDCPAAVSGNDRRHTHWARYGPGKRRPVGICLGRCAHESEDLPVART